jgi:hypothetical protein
MQKKTLWQGHGASDQICNSKHTLLKTPGARGRAFGGSLPELPENGDDVDEHGETAYGTRSAHARISFVLCATSVALCARGYHTEVSTVFT